MTLSRLLLMLGYLTLLGCATSRTLPAHLSMQKPADLRARMAQALPHMACFTAEIRLQYFGPKGRYKGNASLWAQKPAMFRYDVEGPHGGVVLAVATDGDVLQALDVGQNVFRAGSATPAHFDALLPLPPLGLDAAAWTKMFFGDIDIPAHAALSYDDSLGAFLWKWAAAPYEMQVWVAPDSARIVKLEAHQGLALMSQVTVVSRNENGLPEVLELNSPMAKTEVNLRLRDVQTPQEISRSVFSLPEPKGARSVPLTP